MSYAIRNDGKGYRAVNSADDCLTDETYSDDAPVVNSQNPRIAEIKSALVDLDFKKIRPLSSGDTQYLAILNGQTVTLQNELKGLTQ